MSLIQLKTFGLETRQYLDDESLKARSLFLRGLNIPRWNSQLHIDRHLSGDLSPISNSWNCLLSLKAWSQKCINGYLLVSYKCWYLTRHSHSFGTWRTCRIIYLFLFCSNESFTSMSIDIQDHEDGHISVLYIQIY